MFIGISIFAAGMLAFYLINKYFSNPMATPLVLQPLNKQQPVINYNTYSQPVEEHSEYTASRNYDITDSSKLVTDISWDSIDIVNNGPNPVYISVNRWERPDAPLRVGNSMSFSFGKDGIKKIYFKCDSGETANVDVYITK